MVVENPTWVAPRIHGELRMLGFELSERTISRWMKRAPRDPDRAKLPCSSRKERRRKQGVLGLTGIEGSAGELCWRQGQIGGSWGAPVTRRVGPDLGGSELFDDAKRQESGTSPVREQAEAPMDIRALRLTGHLNRIRASHVTTRRRYSACLEGVAEAGAIWNVLLRCSYFQHEVQSLLFLGRAPCQAI